MTGIVNVIALAIFGLSALLLIPILVALGHGEGNLASLMLIFATLGIFLSITILAAIADLQYGLSRSLSFVSLICLWLITSLVGALSFMVFLNMPLGAAWFEAVAALTTSGGSLIPKAATSKTILVWRACMEWYGGFLTLVSVLHILAPGEFGGLINTERTLRPKSGRKTWLPNAAGYQRLITEYTIITLLIAAGLIASGVTSLNAMMLSMVAIATGGFIPFEGALDENISRFGQFVIIIGLLVGTLNIFWRRSIIRNPRTFLRKNVELNYILVTLLILSLVYGFRYASLAGSDRSLENAFLHVLEGLFSATSLIATSGMQTRPGAIAVLPDVLVLVVVLIGASIYSTTGGIKIYRIAMMASHALRELKKLIHPTSVQNLRFGEVVIDEQKMAAIWSHFILSLIIVGIGAFLISIFGFSFDAAVTLAVSLFSNAAPIYDAVMPTLSEITSADGTGWPLLSEAKPLSYLLFSALMLIGRLEVIAIFAVLNFRYWLNR